MDAIEAALRQYQRSFGDAKLLGDGAAISTARDVLNQQLSATGLQGEDLRAITDSIKAAAGDTAGAGLTNRQGNSVGFKGRFGGFR